MTSNPPGIDCGAICQYDFDAGTIVTLTAVPAAGSVFSGWDGTEDCTGTGTCTLEMGEVCEAVATFTAKVSANSAAKLTYSKLKSAFKVKVTSDQAKCIGDRSGTLKKVRSGPDATLASFKTRSTGIAVLKGYSHPKGKFYAVIKAATRYSGLTPITCKEATSPRLALP